MIRKTLLVVNYQAYMPKRFCEFGWGFWAKCKNELRYQFTTLLSDKGYFFFNYKLIYCIVQYPIQRLDVPLCQSFIYSTLQNRLPDRKPWGISPVPADVLCKCFQSFSRLISHFKTLEGQTLKSTVIWRVRKKISTITDHSQIIPKSKIHGLWM